MPHKRKDLKIEGSNLWYLVGLIASDGCLSSDGRHIDITSKDYEFLKKIKDKFRLINKIGTKNKGKVNEAYHVQFSNRNLYEFLLSVGLAPNKSLSLKSLDITKEYFVDFLRGLIDGDGGIQRWIHHTNKREQWNLRIVSGSRIFLVWLNSKIEEMTGARGRLHVEGKNRFRLKYGKMAAREIIKKCYYENCFGLQRKIILARNCVDSYSGWSRSKTVLN